MHPFAPYESMKLEKAWRKRMAMVTRRYRKINGRWPAKWAMEAAKRGIAQAVAQGIQPPVEH